MVFLAFLQPKNGDAWIAVQLSVKQIPSCWCNGKRVQYIKTFGKQFSKVWVQFLHSSGEAGWKYMCIRSSGDCGNGRVYLQPALYPVTRVCRRAQGHLSNIRKERGLSLGECQTRPKHWMVEDKEWAASTQQGSSGGEAFKEPKQKPLRSKASGQGYSQSFTVQFSSLPAWGMVWPGSQNISP